MAQPAILTAFEAMASLPASKGTGNLTEIGDTPQTSSLVATLVALCAPLANIARSTFDRHPIISTSLLALALTFSILHIVLFTPPKNLRHLPRVSPYPILYSYVIRESVDVRIRRWVMPVAERNNDGVVAVWMLGKWGVHLLDNEIIKQVLHSPVAFPKKNYQEHLHFTFLSGPNVVFSNGEMWKRHSAIVRAAFDREVPVYRFVALAWDVCKMISGEGEGEGENIQVEEKDSKSRDGWVRTFSDLVQKYTLDVVGTTLLGHNFDALNASTNSNVLPFVDHFNLVMSKISTPARLMFPFLDTYFPRAEVIAEVDALNARYDKVLEEKRTELGLDILSYMLEDDSLTKEELRSNLSILFSAGHDTTSGALSSCMYFLAKHPEFQKRARDEALEVLRVEGEGGKVTTRDPEYKDHPKFKFLYACIKEAMRINPPISMLPARWTSDNFVLKTGEGKEYWVPKDVSVVPNVYAAHHSKRVWQDPDVFDPDRFYIGAGVSEGADGKKIRPKVPGSAHLPFGNGPRQCVARQFSLYEQRTLLAMLLTRYEWTLPENSPHEKWVQNEFGAFGLSIPHHLDLNFVKRD